MGVETMTLRTKKIVAAGKTIYLANRVGKRAGGWGEWTDRCNAKIDRKVSAAYTIFKRNNISPEYFVGEFEDGSRVYGNTRRSTSFYDCDLGDMERGFPCVGELAMNDGVYSIVLEGTKKIPGWNISLDGTK